MIGMKLVIGLLIVSCLYVLQLFFNKNLALKILVVTSLFVLSSMTYFSFESYKGWPTKEKVTTGYLVDVQIVPPSQDSQGGIYMWVMNDPKELTLFQRLMTYTFEFKPAPRAYYIPYSKEADKKMSGAKKKLKEGMIVKIDGEESNADGVAANKDGKKDGNGGDAHDYDVPHLQIISPDNILKKQG